jgi:hypothetical protein
VAMAVNDGGGVINPLVWFHVKILIPMYFCSAPV